jgi:4-hydroxy-tetrahydrodipicolinate synthase
MSESKRVVEGVIVPLLTPIDSKECVDEAALRKIIRHCMDGGSDGIFVGGTSGFGPLLADDQWERLMEIARDEVEDSVPLLGGVMATSTVRAINRIKIIERIGFKHMVVTPTFYVTPTKEEEFLSHFDACRQATDMNMITYNIPSCTGCSIPLSVITKMVSQGWTSVVKESSGDKDYFLELTKVLSGSGATILQGNEPDIAWGLSIGAKGMVPVCANYAPGLYAAAWQASKDGDETLLAELQERIMAVRETLLMGDKCWLAGAMYGVHSLGIGSGKTLRPIQELKDDEKREIDDLTKSESIS